MTITEGAITGGMHPSGRLGAGVYNAGMETFQVKNAYNANIFWGDPVIMSAGFVQLSPAGVTSETVGPIGVFAGCTYLDNAAKQVVWSNYFPANTSSGGLVEGYSNVQCRVFSDPEQEFQMIGTTSISADKIGGIFKVSAIGSGSTANGQSLCKVDILASAGTSAGALVRVLSLSNVPGNELGDANPQLTVKLYNHKLNV